MKKKIACLQFVISTTFLLLTSIAFAQNNFKITGRITDEANKPLEGVTVQLKGTTTVTTTREGGVFEISVPSEKSVLVITSVGYEQQEIPVGSKRELSVSLKTAQNSMENVVVIGYGT